jgi:predicted nucleic acid-binding Zn finger protein
MIIQHISKSSGKIYQVDITKLTCSCPDWKNRQAKVHGLCKHLVAEIQKTTGQKLDYIQVIKQDSDAVHFVEKYGEEELELLKRKGICYEENGVLKVI